jgi:hypothetical protein
MCESHSQRQRAPALPFASLFRPGPQKTVDGLNFFSKIDSDRGPSSATDSFQGCGKVENQCCCGRTPVHPRDPTRKIGWNLQEGSGKFQISRSVEFGHPSWLMNCLELRSQNERGALPASQHWTLLHRCVKSTKHPKSFVSRNSRYVER